MKTSYTIETQSCCRDISNADCNKERLLSDANLKPNLLDFLISEYSFNLKGFDCILNLKDNVMSGNNSYGSNSCIYLSYLQQSAYCQVKVYTHKSSGILSILKVTKIVEGDVFIVNKNNNCNI